MSIYRREPGGNWYYDITVGGGQRIRKSTMTKIKSQAQAVHDAYLRGEPVDYISLGTALAETAKAATSFAQWNDRMSCRRRILGEGRASGLNGDYPIDNLTPAAIEQYRAGRIAEGLSPATVNKDMTLLRAAHKWARDNGYRVNPNLVFPTTKVKGKMRWLTKKEENLLIHVLTKRWADAAYKAQDKEGSIRARDNKHLTIFLLDTGMRYGEAVNLVWENVDWERKEIRFYRSKTDTWGVIGMTNRVVNLLRFRRGGKHCQYIFPNTRRDGPRSYNSNRGIRSAIAEAKLNTPDKVAAFGRCTIHSFRDTFASRLAQAGMDLNRLAKLLGHSDIKQTQKYAHLVAEDVAASAAAILDKGRE